MGSLDGHKDHGDKPLHRDRKTTTWMNCNRGESAVFCSQQQQAANSQRAATVGAPRSSPQQHLRICTSTQQGHRAPHHVEFLLVHTGHDTEHRGPEENKRERNSRSKPVKQPCTCQCWSRRRARPWRRGKNVHLFQEPMSTFTQKCVK